MTRHLSPDEMIDVAEGLRPKTEMPHLASCETCRRQVEELQSTMTVATAADVPEPSPLFWDNFSARVAEAIRSPQQEPPSSLSFGSWTWSRAAVALAVAAVVIAAGVTMRSGNRVPPSVVADRRAEPALADDPLLDLVADLGVDLDWESAAEAGLTMREGTADRAMTQLSDGERAELQRLLEQELKRSGD
jgi:hypothetical protein